MRTVTKSIIKDCEGSYQTKMLKTERVVHWGRSHSSLVSFWGRRWIIVLLFQQSVPSIMGDFDFQLCALGRRWVIECEYNFGEQMMSDCRLGVLEDEPWLRMATMDILLPMTMRAFFNLSNNFLKIKSKCLQWCCSKCWWIHY